MKPILFTGDWQASWSNLARVEATVEHLLELAAKHGVKLLIHAGDIKEVLNPVDQRVTNAMIGFIQRFRSAGIEFVALLGNHDRIANQDTAQNWFPVLEAAGARVITEPTQCRINGISLAFLPYMNDLEMFRAAAKVLAHTAPAGTVLVFHHELAKAKMNLMTQSTGEGLTVKDLLPKKYLVCVGGHIHLHQQLSANVWYVGSPFACEWGEANQRKGFLLLGSNGSVDFLPGRQPGYHDPTWPGFVPRKRWVGEHVRVHVAVDPKTTNVQAVLNAARKRAETDYPGANVVVLPEEVSNGATELELAKDVSDDAAIQSYIEASIPAALSGREAQLRSYLLHQLDQVAATVRSNAGVEFLRLEACNVLSYQKLEIRYGQRGIHVVSGVNNDWNERSNGAGKTSYLQMLALSLFGRNNKGQQYDQWIRRDLERGEQCWVKLEMKLGDGRLLLVTRGRKPKGLTLHIDGKDVTSGRGEREVQRDLELLTGLTWEVASNALFVDQRETNQLLAGTDTDRKKIFTQFLNLERFAKAQELVKKELSRTDRTLQAANMEREQVCDRVATLDSQLSEWAVPDLRGIEQREKKCTAAMEEADKNLQAAKKQLQDFQRSNSSAGLETARDKVMREMASVSTRISFNESARRQFAEMGPVCPKCQQPVPKQHMESHIAEIARERVELDTLEKKYRQALRNADQTLTSAREKETELRRTVDKLQGLYSVTVQDARAVQAEKAAAFEIQEQRHKVVTLLFEAKLLRKRTKATCQAIEDEVAFLRYAASCFSKDGVPAFIGARLLPRLNRAARHYSDLFCDSTIGVEFQMNGEDLDVCITNDHGGEGLVAQSAGETRMASLITSFALRDVMSPCNLLIADEPGEGLDESNARQFAAGLKQCASRFRTILLTTHNAYVLSELSDQRQVIVSKENGISTVLSRKGNGHV